MTELRLPWRFGLSVGNKYHVYDSTGKPVLILNQSMTQRCSERSAKEIEDVLRYITNAVNSYSEAFDK